MLLKKRKPTQTQKNKIQRKLNHKQLYSKKQRVWPLPKKTRKFKDKAKCPYFTLLCLRMAGLSKAGKTRLVPLCQGVASKGQAFPADELDLSPLLNGKVMQQCWIPDSGICRTSQPCVRLGWISLDSPMDMEKSQIQMGWTSLQPTDGGNVLKEQVGPFKILFFCDTSIATITGLQKSQLLSFLSVSHH